jgi:hypothetical protein
MVGRAIFAHDSYIHDAYISVVEEEGYNPYYAFLTCDPEVSEKCERTARKDGRKVLYRVRIKARREFQTIRKKKA